MRKEEKKEASQGMGNRGVCAIQTTLSVRYSRVFCDNDDSTDSVHLRHTTRKRSLPFSLSHSLLFFRSSLSSPILLPHHEFTEPENRDDDASDRDSREHRHHHIPGGEEEDAEGDGETYEKTVH